VKVSELQPGQGLVLPDGRAVQRLADGSFAISGDPDGAAEVAEEDAPE
jgi:hypothetical protein